MKAVRYDLGARLAVGGMAEVFLASAVMPDGSTRGVVVKRVLPQYSGDPAFLKMFIDEAVITGRLDHPNIVKLIDFGRIDDQLFLALEYVPGMDAEELMLAMRERGTVVPLEVTAFIVSEVLVGLHHAHMRTGPDGRSLGIVHRDVTPGNVLLGLDGSVKVTDFGIAKAARRYGDTKVGVVKGNFQFLAPEQLSTGGAIDRRVDVYGAGMLLRVLLTGQLPFEGLSIPEIIGRVSKGALPGVAEINPELPAEMDAIVRQATARDPAERFATALMFRERLLACARECGAWGTVASLNRILVDVRRGNDDVRLLGGGGSAVLERTGAGEGESSVLHLKSSSQGIPLVDLDDATLTEKAPLPGRPPPPPPRPRTGRHQGAKRPEEATTNLAIPIPGASPDMASTSIDVQALAGETESDTGAVPAEPDDSTTASSAPAPPMPLERARLPAAPLPAPLAYQESVRFAAHRQAVSAVAFAGPMTLVSAGNDQVARVWDLTRPEEIAALRGHTGALTAVAGGPGGVFVTGGRDKTMRSWRAGSETGTRVFSGHTGWVSAVAISSDGLLAASGSVDKTVRIWDVASGAERRALVGHTDAVSALTFLSDGRLLSASYDQSLRLWKDGACQKILGGRIGPVRALAVSSDDVVAVTSGADGALRVWELASGEHAATLPGHEGPVVALAFVPGTALLASASYDGTARLWNLATRAEAGRLTFEGAVTAVAPAPGGGFLACGNGDGSLVLWAPE